MWKKITSIVIILLFIAVLLHPSVITEGAVDGLNLWLRAVIPSLFPFMIISNIIIMSGLACDMNYIMFPITRLLRISADASYCIMSGLLFGYPSCAVSACEMYRKGIINRDTAEYCSCCFNNISPAFIAGYFCNAVLNNSRIIPAILIIFYSVTFLTALLLRYTVFKNLMSISGNNSVKNVSSGHWMDAAVLSALVNIGRLGGYIIIFSIICRAIEMTGIPAPLRQMLCSATEITTGLEKLGNAGLPSRVLITAGIPMLHFGGLCGMFQTFGIDTSSVISKKKYICSKIITFLFSGLVTYLAVYVLKISS